MKQCAPSLCAERQSSAIVVLASTQGLQTRLPHPTQSPSLFWLNQNPSEWFCVAVAIFGVFSLRSLPSKNSTVISPDEKVFCRLSPTLLSIDFLCELCDAEGDLFLQHLHLTELFVCFHKISHTGSCAKAQTWCNFWWLTMWLCQERQMHFWSNNEKLTNILLCFVLKTRKRNIRHDFKKKILFLCKMHTWQTLLSVEQWSHLSPCQLNDQCHKITVRLY